MADKKKMSVADILAAARKTDGGEGSGGAADAPAPESAAPSPVEQPAATPPPAAEKPAAVAPAKPAAGGKVSTSDILAMARANKAAAAEKSEPKPAAAPQPKAAPKPAAKAKPAAGAESAKPAPAGPKVGTSILADQSRPKSGPMSKAEAAAKAKVPEAKGKAPKGPAPPMPAKPAYAQSKPKAEPVVERREMLAMVMGAILGMGFVGAGFLAMFGSFTLWALGVARFMFPNVLREPPSRFKIGFPSDFPYGVVVTKFKAQYGVWVVNYEYNGKRELYALQSVCTHLGCTPNWLESEQKFKCPCHGSGFYKDGINFEGPAPRPLERFAIRLADDGQLEIDKSRKYQEEMGQWSDPSSFVPPLA